MKIGARNAKVDFGVLHSKKHLEAWTFFLELSQFIFISANCQIENKKNFPTCDWTNFLWLRVKVFVGLCFVVGITKLNIVQSQKTFNDQEVVTEIARNEIFVYFGFFLLLNATWKYFEVKVWSECFEALNWNNLNGLLS